MIVKELSGVELQHDVLILTDMEMFGIARSLVNGG